MSPSSAFNRSSFFISAVLLLLMMMMSMLSMPATAAASDRYLFEHKLFLVQDGNTTADQMWDLTQIETWLTQQGSPLSFVTPAEEPLSCVDGRETEGIIAVTGGDLGAFTTALTVFAEKTNQLTALSTVDGVKSSLTALLNAFPTRPFYGHTDEHNALPWLVEAGVNASTLTNEAVIYDTLVHPSAAVLSNLRQTIANHMGCGHMNNMYKSPQKYNSTAALVAAAWSAFFELLWAGNSQIKLVMLPGDHLEKAVVSISSNDSTLSPSSPPLLAQIKPHVTAGMVFVYYPQADAYRIREYANYLVNLPVWAPHSPPTAATLAAEIQSRADLQRLATLSILAPTKPVYELAITPTVKVSRASSLFASPLWVLLATVSVHVALQLRDHVLAE